MKNKILLLVIVIITVFLISTESHASSVPVIETIPVECCIGEEPPIASYIADVKSDYAVSVKWIKHPDYSTVGYQEPVILATDEKGSQVAVVCQLTVYFKNEDRLDNYKTDTYDVDYWIHVPNNATENMPLIVFLHGDGETGSPKSLENYGPIKMTRELYGNDYPFILLMPNTRRFTWTKQIIADTTFELIDYIKNEYKCSKVILTGHSRGGMGVWYFASRYNDYFSCAVSISGYEMWKPYPTIPLIAIYGTGDNSGCKGMQQWLVKETNKAGGNAESKMIKSLHGNASEKAFTQELFDWMLSQ